MRKTASRCVHETVRRSDQAAARTDFSIATIKRPIDFAASLLLLASFTISQTTCSYKACFGEATSAILPRRKKLAGHSPKHIGSAAGQIPRVCTPTMKAVRRAWLVWRG